MTSWFEQLQGETALVIGGGDGLARLIRTRFRRVVAADLTRSLDAPPRTRVLKEGDVLFVQGIDAQPDHLPHGCDLIILAFSLPRRDNPAEFLSDWVKLLNHRGKLVLLEWSPAGDRYSPEQRLHLELLETLESKHEQSRITSRDLIHLMQKAGLIHVRQFTDAIPAYFNEADARLLAADGLSELRAVEMVESDLADRIREQRRVQPGPVLIVHGIYKAQVEKLVEELAEPEVGEGQSISKTDALQDRIEQDTSLIELLAGVLQSTVENPHSVAERLLRAHGRKGLVSIRDAKELARENKLPIDVAEQLIRIFALGRRLFSESTELEIHGPEDAYHYLAPEMAHLTREHFRGLYLNVKGGLVVDEVISIGTLTSALVHPREVFGPAVEKHCHSVLIAHNHPSGDPTPSSEDIRLTRELAEAGRLLNIELLDHIIIGHDSYSSLKQLRHFG
jgi:DNA repair protein RadC